MIRAFALAVTLIGLAATAPAAGAQPAPDSLSLKEALAVARERSPVLTFARAGVDEADALRSLARAGRGPRLSVEGTYLAWPGVPAVSLGQGGTFAPLREHNFLFRLGVSQPIFTSGRVSSSVRAAERGREAAEHSAEYAEVELTAAVALAHNDALLARAQLEVARQAVQVLEEAVRVAREHYGSGTVARMDVLRAESRLSTARSELRAAEALLPTAEEQLAALVGLDPADAPAVAGSLEYEPIHLEAAPLPTGALAGRSDLDALQAQAAAEEAVASAARAQRLPAVSLFASVLTSRPELITGRNVWAVEALGGVSVSWPFFDSGSASAEARAAEAAAARTRAEADRVADSVAVVVRAQAREMNRAALDVAAGRENVIRAERVLSAAQDRYAEGIGIQLDVLEAETDLRRVRASLNRAVHAHRAARIELKRGLGLSADAILPLEEGGRR